MQIEGKNQVVEAIKNEATINKILVDKNFASRRDDVINLARKNGLKVEFLPKKILDAQSVTGHHQGYIAQTVDFEYSSIQEILKYAKSKNTQDAENENAESLQNFKSENSKNKKNADFENGVLTADEIHEKSQNGEKRGKFAKNQPFIVLLDGIEDPHNLGAIIRTCECAGVDGIIIPKARACQVNETVVRTSAGAISHMKIARVANLKTAIDELKENGLWIYACELGGQDLYSQNLTGPIAVVIGSEGNGIKQSLRTYCDGVLTLPQLGSVNSLNASVSAGIVIYEILRQRASE